MGEPVGDEYSPGDDATVCWGLGKTFGDVSTPKSVYLTFTGLLGGWINANKTFIATQRVGFPFIWDFDDGNFVGFWTYTAINCSARVSSPGGGAPHFTLFGNFCALVAVNGAASCTIS